MIIGVGERFSALGHWVTLGPFDKRNNKGRGIKFGDKMISSVLDILNLRCQFEISSKQLEM